jgi:hypothetical protein
MWGISSVLVAAAVGAIFLLFALVVGASPIFAFLIFAIVAVALGALLIVRRGAEPGHGSEATGRGSTQPQPRSGGAPASGEGGPPVSGETGMPPR